MKKGIVVILAALMCITGAAALAGCKDEPSKSIKNGGFEAGNISGWTASGMAFTNAGVSDSAAVGGGAVGKVGERFFNGAATVGGPTGTLKSSNFKIAGKGYIALLIGAGKDNGKCYISVKNSAKDADGKNAELARQANDAFDGIFITDTLVRYVIDVSEHIGKMAYIEVIDNDSSTDYGYLMLDDIVTYIDTDAKLDTYRAEKTTKVASLTQPEFVEDKTLTTIQNPGFNDSENTAFTRGIKGWKILNGNAFTSMSIMESTEVFWGEQNRKFFAEGTHFLNGFNNGEDKVGAIRSSMFTLGGDGYISFLLGGMNGTKTGYVAVCSEDGTELFKQMNTAFNEPRIALNLTRYYIDASEHIGDVMYIKIVDEAKPDNFSALTADDIRVSMTEEAVSDLIVETYEAAAEEESSESNDYVVNHYANAEYPMEAPKFVFKSKIGNKELFQEVAVDVEAYLEDAKAGLLGDKDNTGVGYGIEKIVFGNNEITSGFDSVDLVELGNYTVHYYASLGTEVIKSSFVIGVAQAGGILNGGFESGNMVGWEIVTPDTFKPETAVSGDTKFWAENIPYNQSGNYHLDGWAAQFDEAHAWGVRSTTFELGGSGWISFKMGGNAAEVRVFLAGGTQIATYVNDKFLDVPGVVDVSKGSRLATMTTFVADLSAYKGQEMYVELWDRGSGGWAVAFFDDIIVNYETAPVIGGADGRHDLVSQKFVNGEGETLIDFTDHKLMWEAAENSYTPPQN